MTALVIGAGPAGLMAAEELARAGLRVDIADQMPSPARKFLMAGKSGLNLTHSGGHGALRRNAPRNDAQQGAQRQPMFRSDATRR